ncbi:glycosyltransferase family 4 protein [Candidatus Kaiserbacteria bacterium]|nr:MAG: glycosyltransferase family 4 protein [Candidatus Kaiserbacteria bacterium]
MKILITTQAVDKNDPILGFFHGWLLEFAKYFERVEVICLREGVHTLPAHVHVHSLGKEKGVSYIRYLSRLFYSAWTLRSEYDVVFSHMNPHYIVLCGWLWRLLGKPMFFWRNHARMNMLTRVAARFARRVFYTSPLACTRVFPHALQMPVGINTEVFQPMVGKVPKEKSLLFFGRLSPVKRPELFIAAANMLSEYTVDVYGDVQNANGEYGNALRKSAGKHITFHDAVTNHEAPAIYSTHEIYVNLTPEGSMDKTVLEAAACGALVLVTNTSFKGMLPDLSILSHDSAEGVRDGVLRLSALSESEKNEYRTQLQKMVREQHSLSKLVGLLQEQFTQTT